MQIVYLILWVSASLHQTFQEVVYPLLPAEDYIVVSSLVNLFVRCNQDQIRRYTPSRERPFVFIQPTTSMEYVNEYTLNDLKEAIKKGKPGSFPADTAWTAFFMSVSSEQFKQYTVENKLRLPSKQIVLWTKALSDQNFSRSATRPEFLGLREAYKPFCAIISFSNVVYSSDRQKAVCYFSENKHGDGGSGHIVFLQKTEGTWIVVGSHML